MFKLHEEWMPGWRDQWVSEYVMNHLANKGDMEPEQRKLEAAYAKGYAECLFNVIGWRAMQQVIGVQ